MKRWSRRVEDLEQAVAALGIGPDSCIACLPPVQCSIFVRDLDEEIPRCPSCGELVDQYGRRVGQMVVIDLGSEERAALARAKQEAKEAARKDRAQSADGQPPT